ncbi:MAG: LemA family protein [Leuconostoc gelidum]|jgi:LemA protein|uniref:LemA family protein n=1 Tax=Leuconostoc gelidum subsp. gelidum TaxID=1607839 RepID=A0AB35FZH8_LEUGE|nr:LemA family protein [Leuconostoc gelidum]AFS40652.1 LemA protein [Leuconostoc gelidum JB7]MBZ5963782.1 LemA family protein [Leuconostoc gelidum subsp. gelidum]MBZ5975375.1 LemA family protein [Leuconostoc gelidum subsp. gelidum]MBZ5976454.1 LemA family protein [Leuconostoc gelidum subsp. gelidum]MBZ5978549.1 LemA family protein [Leuconostoc gelidum subsp. gelidum]
MTLLIIIAVVAVIAIIWISIYNSLIKYRMQTKESWSQIDVQLKRRNDLIPNLVNTVKGYADFEKTTLQAVTDARTSVNSAQGPAATMAASDQLSGALTHLFAVAEAYPDLKASANFTKLQEELTNTENKIAYSRQLFNTTTASYNTKLQSFPSNIIAGIHHFEPSEFIAVPETEKDVPTVKF